MNNKPCIWKCGDSVRVDEYWIAYLNPVTGRVEYWKQSNTGKPIYTVGYAKKCLSWYQSVYVDYPKMWIEPAYRRLS